MMKSPTAVDMAEVTRLTRAGRLDEAMNLLRGQSGTHPGLPPRASATADREAVRTGDQSDVVDMEPPTDANGGVWTAAWSSAAGANSGRGDSEDASARMQNPPRRSLLNRTTRRGIHPALRTSHVAIGVPPGARYEARTYAGAPGSLGYTMYVPSGGDQTPRPLVVMLHGCSQSPDDFARGTRMNELAEEHGFVVVYPAQSQAANASRCWSWFNPADQRRDSGEPALIAGITRAVIDELAVDPSRVYVAGLSAGGAMAAIMGQAYPDLYAATGVHSGLAPGSASDIVSAFGAMQSGSSQQVTPTNIPLATPTIVFHGDADTTVHPLNADRVTAHARGNLRGKVETTAGTSDGGIAYRRTVESDAGGKPVLEQWVLHDAGHAWSGGDASGSFVEPRGPDASKAMWRFFCARDKARAA